MAALRAPSNPVATPPAEPQKPMVAASLNDEPAMVEPGFGAVLLTNESNEEAEHKAEVEVALNQPNGNKRPVYTQSNFRNNWAAHNAAGGIALQPNNLSEKAK